MVKIVLHKASGFADGFFGNFYRLSSSQKTKMICFSVSYKNVTYYIKSILTHCKISCGHLRDYKTKNTIVTNDC